MNFSVPIFLTESGEPEVPSLSHILVCLIFSSVVLKEEKKGNKIQEMGICEISCGFTSQN